MEDQQYEWDDKKNEANIAEHQVSFDDAKAVFADPFALGRDDEKHSSKEPRFLIVGKISDGRIITACFTRRRGKVRLISAQERRKDRREYEKQFQENTIPKKK